MNAMAKERKDSRSLELTPSPNPSPQGAGELGVPAGESPSPLRGGVRGGSVLQSPPQEPARPLATARSVPRLPRHVRLHFDPVRQAWALLSPEKVLWPDEVSLSILHLCDGQRSIALISRMLAAEYEADAQEIEADVLAFAQDWSDRMVLRL
jgi:pyrroloquinoline quinone biosynthesis protein D